MLAESLRRIGADLGVEVDAAEAAEFGDSVGTWPAFADSAAALRRLQQRYRLIILSNVDRASFARSNRRLGVTFDLILTAEDIGSYKPDPANFDRLLAEVGPIGVERGELLHVAQSLFHDHGPAQRIGLPSVWIDRYGTPAGTGASPPSDVTSTGGTHRWPSSPTRPWLMRPMPSVRPDRDELAPSTPDRRCRCYFSGARLFSALTNASMSLSSL